MAKVNFKRPLFEFISIVVAVVLAMALTEWRQNQLNRKLAEKSLQNIIAEIQDNRDDLAIDSAKIAADLRFMKAWITDFEEKSEKNDFSLNFDYSFLNRAALDVAINNQSMTYIDFEINMALAEIYNTQEFYSQKALDVFDAMGELTTSTHHPESAEFLAKVKGFNFQLGLVMGSIRAYMVETEQFLSTYNSEN
ncbi:hypothetical protein BXY85_1744 [Roseivirga pacifica]|uniref:Uncharacterized protein n=1 Tax=Roseivirga pacifica TaxID=1267423 RepID=A0A1I0MW31_9BACT|nr:hypothetical protein [Roseivirga pacifica]MCO6359256.1 hypothetical protein [Roseivirga pacifica]MCO6365108.1 hypothetical protein [Roseivirga pacifica]MCO6372162.1 hypothetical protein [Roseivirga pacifica]MCO6375727.1 hypothetical protein [Roseivirga pacifica]MCO6379540.1 hypothetical protein [Roseivirga pacifica]